MSYDVLFNMEAQGYSIVDKIQEILGVPPPVEYARVQARGKA